MSPIACDADIERMLRDSFEHAKEDVHARALAEYRVEGRRLIEATRSALHADRALFRPAGRQAPPVVHAATSFSLPRRLAPIR